MNQDSYDTRMQFNTGTFLIISGFATYIQTRNQPLKYLQWCLSKWFGLIPLMTLCILISLPLADSKAQLDSISPGTQVYLLVMQIAGLGWIGASGNFGYLHNLNAWNTAGGFGDVGFAFSSLVGIAYFGSLLFMLLLLFALLHYTLTFKLPRQMFQGCSGLGAGLCAIAMIAVSVALGFLSTPANATRGEMLATSGNCNFLAPLLMLGVCVAELRYHLPARAKAVLGHWLVVDVSIVAFTVLTFAPLPGTVATYGQNTNLRMCQKMLPYATTLAVGCDATNDNFWSVLPKSVAISATQQILFCLVLLCLSCQAYHKKKSLVVFGIFERSIVCDFLGRYSYVLYLFPQVLLHLYVKDWLGTSSLHGEMARLLVGVLGVTLAMIAQWWQDTYVLQANIWLLDYLRSDWRDGALMSERNPLSGLVVWYTHIDRNSLSAKSEPTRHELDDSTTGNGAPPVASV